MNHGSIYRKENGRKDTKEKKPTDMKQMVRVSQTFDCSFYEFSRTASVALTQLNRATKTIKIMNMLKKRAKKNYTSIVYALNLATNNATTCSGEKIESTSKDNFQTLKDICSTTNIIMVCNPALVTLFDSSTEEFLASCMTKLESFNNQFKVCFKYQLSLNLIGSIFRTASSNCPVAVLQGFVMPWMPYHPTLIQWTVTHVVLIRQDLKI